MKIAAKINLEVLSSKQLYAVLFVVNATVLIAIGLSVWYQTFEAETVILNPPSQCSGDLVRGATSLSRADYSTAAESGYFGYSPRLDSQNFAACPSANTDGAGIVWTSAFSVASTLQLFFSVDVVLRRGNFSEALPLGSASSLPLTAVFVSDLPVRVSIRSRDDDAVLADVFKFVSLTCAAADSLCARLHVAADTDYKFRIASAQTINFNVQIAFLSWSPFNLTNATAYALAVTTHSSSAVYTEVYMRSTGLGCTLIVLAYWLWKVRTHRALKLRALADWKSLYEVSCEEEQKCLAQRRVSSSTAVAPQLDQHDVDVSSLQFSSKVKSDCGVDIGMSASATSIDAAVAAAHEAVAAHHHFDCNSFSFFESNSGDLLSAADERFAQHAAVDARSSRGGSYFETDSIVIADCNSGTVDDRCSLGDNEVGAVVCHNQMCQGNGDGDSELKEADVELCVSGGQFDVSWFDANHGDDFLIRPVSYRDAALENGGIVGELDELDESVLQERCRVATDRAADKPSTPMPAFHFSESASQAALFGIVNHSELILFEQRWIPALLVALVFYQNPVFAVRAFRPSPFLWMWSGIFYSIAAGLMMVFLLVFVRELGSDHQRTQARRHSVAETPTFAAASGRSRNSRRPSSAGLADTASTGMCCSAAVTSLCERLQEQGDLFSDPDALFSLNFGDFAPYAFFVAYECIAIVAVVLNATRVASATATSLKPSLSALQAALQVNALQYVSIGLVCLWVVWFMFTLYTSRQRLRALPYISYRYRQLAFRMFAYMSAGIILFLVVISISATIAMMNGNVGATNQYTNSLGDANLATFFIVSIYVWVSAYIYLPIEPTLLNLPPLLNLRDPTLGDQVDDVKRGLQRFVTQHFPDMAAIVFDGNTAERPPRAIVAIEARASGRGDEQCGDELTTAPPSALEALVASAGVGLQGLLATLHRVLALNAPVRSDPVDRFSFHTARALCAFSWEAYYDPPEVPEFEVIDVITDERTDTCVFVAVRNDTVVVSFRGSASLQNILTDLTFARTDMAFAVHPHPSVETLLLGQPLIHLGFAEAYNSIRMRLLRLVSAAIGRPAAVFLSDELVAEPPPLSTMTPTTSAAAVQTSTAKMSTTTLSSLSLPSAAVDESMCAEEIEMTNFDTPPAVYMPTESAPAPGPPSSPTLADRFFASVPSLQSLLDDAKKSLLTTASSREFASALSAVRTDFEADAPAQAAASLAHVHEERSADATAPASASNGVGSVAGSHRRIASHGDQFSHSDAFRSLLLGTARGSDTRNGAAPSLPFDADDLLAQRRNLRATLRRHSREPLPQDSPQCNGRSPLARASSVHRRSTLDTSFQLSAPPTSPNVPSCLNVGTDEATRLPLSPPLRTATAPVVIAERNCKIDHVCGSTSSPAPESIVPPPPAALGRAFKIFCTGHSLGGALASLAAMDLVGNFATDAAKDGGDTFDVSMYSYGAPRLGNVAFCRAFDQLVPNAYRVVCDGDIVVSTPPKLAFMFRHHGQEIVVDRDGNYLFNPSFVEKSMRGGRSSIADHTLGSYIRSLEAALQQHDEYVVQERRIARAYRLYMDKHRRVAEAWNEQ